MEEKKIGIYCRVSSRDQAVYGYGLDAQKAKCLQFLELYDYAQSDYKMYIDDGYSAKSLDRPRMNELMNDVHSGIINVIVVYKLDRLARSVVDTYKLIQDLIEHDCQLIAVIDRLDIDSANGRMIVGMLAVFAQWEREVIIERTRDGLESMVAKGKYPYGTTPFGWNKTKDNYLFINEEQASLLNDLADQSLSGASVMEIKKYLKDKYGIERSERTIERWLTRSINIGDFIFHDQVIKNIVPPIMNESKFKKLCSSIGRHASKSIDSYLFSNKVYCRCGNKCRNSSTNKRVGKNIVKYYYYECEICRSRINENAIFEQVAMSVFLHHDNEKISQALKKQKAKLDNLRIKISELYKRYVNDEIDVVVYGDTVTKLKTEYDRLNRSILGLNIDNINDLRNAEKGQKKLYIGEVIDYLTVDVYMKLVIDVKWNDSNGEK